MNWAHGVPPWKKVDERGCDIPYLGYARQKCFVTEKIECSGKKKHFVGENLRRGEAWGRCGGNAPAEGVAAYRTPSPGTS